MAKTKKTLREAHPSTNPYDSKPIRNPLAGANWKPLKGNKFAGGVAHDRGGPHSKMSFPTSRIGLVYRSLEDGANLIEDSGKLIRMIERELGLSEYFFHGGECDECGQAIDTEHSSKCSRSGKVSAGKGTKGGNSDKGDAVEKGKDKTEKDD
jgi:hypothetical protein